jgi:hypothetical protein
MVTLTHLAHDGSNGRVMVTLTRLSPSTNPRFFGMVTLTHLAHDGSNGRVMVTLTRVSLWCFYLHSHRRPHPTSEDRGA